VQFRLRELTANGAEPILENDMRFPSGNEDYPPSWSKFNENFNLHSAADFGFLGTKTDISRFAARYRAARCYLRVEFKNLALTQETANGYSKLCRLVLTYSAFECLLRALKLRENQTSAFLNDQEKSTILKKVRRLDPGDALFAFMKPHLNKQHQEELRLYLSGKPCNPFFLASGIRHLFVHGELTPNPKDVKNNAVQNVSDYLTSVLVKVMDREFKKRIDEFEIADRNVKQGS
jgi:hypothetical protein